MVGIGINIAEKINQIQRVRLLARKPISATSMTISAAMPRLNLPGHKSVKVGILAPLTGSLTAWGQPGRDGCLIWADWVNARGGLDLGDERYRVDIISFDDAYDSAKAMEGAKKLIQDDKISILLMLGGDDWLAVRDYVNSQKMLTTTLLPSDLSPDSPYLIAPCEVHPLYNLAGVEWLSINRPELRTAAICTQDDALGLPALAAFRAAFEAAGIEIVKEIIYPADTPDVPNMASALIGSDPDILCWGTAAEPVLHALTEEAYRLGYKGQMIASTADNYIRMMERTSREFMEGFLFHFPDFDDPALNDSAINFSNPADFFTEYNHRYPGTWSAVSWEYYAILEQWKAAVERARTFDPVSVMAAMKTGGVGKHVFGDARWWGRELFGIDQALIGNWPVVQIQQGKARILEFRSLTDWYEKHGDILIKHMKAYDQMWYQRVEFLNEAG